MANKASVVLPVTSTAMLALMLLGGAMALPQAQADPMTEKWAMAKLSMHKMTADERYTQYYRALTIAQLCENVAYNPDASLISRRVQGDMTGVVGDTGSGMAEQKLVSGIASEEDSNYRAPGSGQNMSGLIGETSAHVPDANAGSTARVDDSSSQKMSSSYGGGTSTDNNPKSPLAQTLAMGGSMSATGETEDSKSLGATGSQAATRADDYGQVGREAGQTMSGSGSTEVHMARKTSTGFPLMLIDEAKADGRAIVEQKGCSSDEAKGLLSVYHQQLDPKVIGTTNQ